MAAGAATPFSFAPYNVSFIVFISLSVLFYLCSKSSPGNSFIIGWTFGFAFFGMGVNWLHISINLFGGVNLFIAYLFTYLLIAFLSLYPGICVWLANRYFPSYRLLAFPLLWVITEWLRGWLFSGFPWLNIGASQTDTLFAAVGPIAGVYGISFFIASLASLSVMFLDGSLRQRAFTLLIVAIFFLFLLFTESLLWTQSTGKQIQVALIQGAVPQKLKWKASQRQKTLDTYIGLSQPHWSANMIIWPETAIPSLYHLADDFVQRIEAEKGNSDTLFMSGIAYKDQKTKHYYNSVLLIDDAHRFYHKNQLVPFGEYLPFKSLLSNLLAFLNIPMSDFSAGAADMKLITTTTGTIGMSICYEDAYSSQMRATMPEANILVNVSNDAWFGDSIAPHQHLQIARMRAIENGRYLLRATNTGISAIINENGEIVGQSPQFQPHALHGKVSLLTGSTPYSRYGNTPLLIVMLLLLIGTAWYQRSNRLKV